MNFSDITHDFLLRQLPLWENCKNGYDSLYSALFREFAFDGFNIKVQFNPGRLISTSAKVDPKSIAQRRCFLCQENLPVEQIKLPWNNDYLILVNPFPIFPEHFTIPHIMHLPQEILKYFRPLNQLSFELKEKYLVFYNGPKCGASAPDHFHFQAGSKGFVPIENDYFTLKTKFSNLLFSNSKTNIFGINDGLRKFIAIESSCLNDLDLYFGKIYENLSIDHTEPLLNIISIYDIEKQLQNGENGWIVLIFLREKHRPDCYFAEGESNLMLSPASVDIGGVCVLPLEKDFEKISQKDIAAIFNEVFISDAKYQDTISNINSALAQ